MVLILIYWENKNALYWWMDWNIRRQAQYAFCGCYTSYDCHLSRSTQPPGGLWQDDYHPEANSTLPAIRKFNSSAPIPNEAGTPIGLRKFPFWVLLSLNSLTFMLSYSKILLLILSQDIYWIVRLSLISLSVCYMVSLTVIISTRLWETFWYVFICLLLCIFLLNASATCVAWSYKACL